LAATIQTLFSPPAVQKRHLPSFMPAMAASSVRIQTSDVRVGICFVTFHVQDLNKFGHRVDLGLQPTAVLAAISAA
jgi:hypothetical protein